MKTKVQKDNNLSPETINERIDKVANLIAGHYGHNVPYCESMDMSLFPVVVAMCSDELEKEIKECYKDYPESLTEDLRFLAVNGRLLPKTLKDASLDEFRNHIRKNQKGILDEIAKELTRYEKELNY